MAMPLDIGAYQLASHSVQYREGAVLVTVTRPGGDGALRVGVGTDTDEREAFLAAVADLNRAPDADEPKQIPARLVHPADQEA